MYDKIVTKENINGQLKDKVAIITGASSGIGRATAYLLAGELCHLVLLSRNAEKLHQVKNEIKSFSNSKIIVLPADVSDYKAINNLGKFTMDELGRIDYLINNAGIGLFKSLDKSSVDEIHKVLDINLMGAIYCTKSVLPFMKQERSGHIINLSSVAGRRGFAQLTAYSASKYGLIGFSDSLRAELLKEGIPIYVTVICPPAVDTSFFTNADYLTYKEDHPLVNLLNPEDVAKEILKVCLIPGKWEILLTPRAKILNFLNKLSPKLIEYLNRKAAQAVNKK